MVPCKRSKTGWKYVTQKQLDEINAHKNKGKWSPPPQIHDEGMVI